MLAFKNYFIYYTHTQIIKKNLLLGSNTHNLSRINSYYILGLYCKFSIININKILPMLKKKISFFFASFKKLKPDFLIINKNLNLGKYFKNKLFFLKINFFFGQWWNGYLKNFKSYFLKSIKNREFFFFNFPLFIFFISSNISMTRENSPISAAAEFSKLGLPSIFFIDDNIPKKIIDNGILLNTKTLKINIFYLQFCLSMIQNLLMLKKENFYKELLTYVIFKNFPKIFLSVLYKFFFSVKKKKKIKFNFFWKNF